MAPPRTIAALGRLFRRQPAPSNGELAVYAGAVEPVLERAERLYNDWFEQAALFVDSEKLGNAAAIHRWQAATMARALGGVVPPVALASAHDELIGALQTTSRAAQLLSSGSRFHNANAVCDGQTMLEVARAARIDAERQIRRVLLRARVAAREAVVPPIRPPTLPLIAPSILTSEMAPPPHAQPNLTPPQVHLSDTVPTESESTPSPGSSS